jgi:nicotinamide riboside kinase
MKLPDNFKIAICGSHSCGKTTLIKKLQKHIEIPVIHEIAATFEPETRFNMETQQNIMNAQIDAESRYKSFLSDRSVVDNLAYTTLVKEEHGDPRNKYPVCVKMAENHFKDHPYNLLIIVDEILPYKPAPHRNFKSYDSQIYILNFIKNYIHQHTMNGKFYNNMDLLYISGNPGKRIKTILNYLT